MPLYLQAEQALRSLIATCEPGDLLPPETELAARLGVSRITIRHAMQRLVTAGLIARRSGRGTEVLPRRIDAHLDFTPFQRALEAGGHHVETREVSVRRRRPTSEEAEALELVGEADDIVEVRRMSLVDGRPFAFLHTVLAPGVPVPDELHGPLYEELERLGVSLVRIEDVARAVPADGGLARRLRVRRGEPILVISRVAREATGRPVEASKTYLRGEAGYAVEHKR